MGEVLKRDLNKTYLIISNEDASYEETYETEMIVKNNPQTFLPLHVLRVDGFLQLYYDISSKQTLKSCSDRVKLNGDTVKKLFLTVKELESDVTDYLLDMESVVLDLEHIYTKEGNFYFCYCPWKKRDVLTSFREMLEEILGNLDYHDAEGVELAYHLYQSACKGNFQLEEILEEHCKEEKEIKETEKQEVCFPIEEELSEEFLRDLPKEKETVKEEKKGILWKILQFFLKKEIRENDAEEEKHFEETHWEYFKENNDEITYTEVLTPVESGTVLLQNMPAGKWCLRPLVPGYEEFCIKGEDFLVGKKRDSVDGFIGRDTISRIHSRLLVRQKRLYIADMNSTNGTYVNGTAIEPGEEIEIFEGDRILFADVGYECYNSL